MKDFIEYIIKNIVDNPDDVRIEETEDDRGKVIEVYLAQEDKPLVIGKEGRNIKAIRNLSLIAGKKNDENFYIKIID